MPLANGIGLTYEGCHDNWELTTDKLAKDFDHHCTICKKAGNKTRCFGEANHLFLCDICGVPRRLRNGCDTCDNPTMINMVMLRQWDPTIDPREEWQEYVLAVQKDSKLVKEYPDLVYDEASWEVDLRAHIIVRRRKWWSGVESRERAEAKEAKKKTKLEAVAANRKRQIKATRKGLGQKKTQAGNLRSQGKWDLQMSKEVRK